jgi:hypothetical protein
VADRAERQAYVRFKRVAVENKAESIKQGKFVAIDVDFALITPPYSKDVVELKVKTWFDNLEVDANAQRIPREWVQNYRAAYKAWLNGQEMPLSGTPIRGWGVLSPAQQENLIRQNILTVEDLAGVNDEGARRIGMGAIELKNKAIAWLRQLDDKGPLTQECAALKAENAALRIQVETLTRQVAELRQKQPVDDGGDSLTADDILPESETTTKRTKK